MVEYTMPNPGTIGEEPTGADWRGCLLYNYYVSVPFFYSMSFYDLFMKTLYFLNHLSDTQLSVLITLFVVLLIISLILDIFGG